MIDNPGPELVRQSTISRRNAFALTALGSAEATAVAQAQLPSASHCFTCVETRPAQAEEMLDLLTPCAAAMRSQAGNLRSLLPMSGSQFDERLSGEVG